MNGVAYPGSVMNASTVLERWYCGREVGGTLACGRAATDPS
jgi:hypothetical protein